MPVQASLQISGATICYHGTPPTLGIIWMECAGHVGDFQMKTLPAPPSYARSHGIKHATIPNTQCALFQASTPTLVAIVRNGGSPPTLGTVWMDCTEHVGDFQIDISPSLLSHSRSRGTKHATFSSAVGCRFRPPLWAPPYATAAPRQPLVHYYGWNVLGM